MKYLILSLLSLIFVDESIAQTTYKSSHVQGGKTIQFTVPTGYFFVVNSDVAGDAMYLPQEGVDYEEASPVELGLGILMFMHEFALEDATLDSIREGLNEELLGENKGLIAIEEPTIVQLNGREFLRGGFKGEVEGDIMAALYFGVTRYGDYYVFVSYYAPGEVEDVLSYDSFKKIMTTWKEVESDEVDWADLELEMDQEYEGEEMYEDLEIYYQNDLFETEISYYDILPDFGENWDEPLDESGHLLSMFTYKDNNGSIKIFSGGKAINYPSDKEKADAIRRATDCPNRLSIKYSSEFSNEDHVFKLFTISGGGTMTSVYTTVVNDELLFFVIDGGKNSVPDFKPAVRDLMLTMWIDYFDEEEE